MNKVLYYIIIAATLASLFTGCRRQSVPASEQQESKEAKRLLQGIWMDEESETAVFQMKGDSVFYSDSTSMPARFMVVGDTLFMGPDIRYLIVKQTEHVLWFKTKNGETMKFVKSSNEDIEGNEDQFTDKPQILSLTEVLKRDTVAHYDGERYHLYIAVNPTKYKVVRTVVNEDGLEVKNVYYDNIIHLSIFKGAAQLFSRDFRKQFYEQKVPKNFLTQSILNNMEFSKIDEEGFHLNVSLCMPYDASCYLVETVIGFDGKISTKLLEY